MASRREQASVTRMTLIWLLVWFLAGHHALILNPVNAWAATLILAVALDLSRPHNLARRSSK